MENISAEFQFEFKLKKHNLDERATIEAEGNEKCGQVDLKNGKLDSIIEKF